MNRTLIIGMAVLIAMGSCNKKKDDVAGGGEMTVDKLKVVGGSKADEFNKGYATSDGGFIVVGSTSSYDGDLSFRTGTQSDSKDGLVIKYSREGEVQWKKTFGGSNEDIFTAVIEASGGGYLLIGYTGSNDGDLSGNHGVTDVWIMKITAAGEKTWSKLLGGSRYDNAFNAINADNGNWLLVGSTSSTDGDLQGMGNRLFASDGWVIKFNAEGTVVWNNVYTANAQEIFNCAIHATGGGFLIGGSRGSSSATITCRKIDAGGSLIWTKSHSSSQNGEVALIGSMLFTSDNGMLGFGFAGQYESPFPANAGENDGLIFKQNEDGEIQWAKYIGGTDADMLKGMVNLSGKDFLLAGSSASKDGHVNGNKGKTDAWYVMVNEQGGLTWSKTFGGTQEDEFVDALLLSNKKVVLIGNTKSNDGDITGHHGEQDALILMLK